MMVDITVQLIALGASRGVDTSSIWVLDRFDRGLLA